MNTAHQTVYEYLPESQLTTEKNSLMPFHTLSGTNTRVHDYSQSSTLSLAQTRNYKINVACTEHSKHLNIALYRTTKGDHIHVTATASLIHLLCMIATVTSYFISGYTLCIQVNIVNNMMSVCD